jgi:pyruvate/2-oxoglutarate dehydrogenase complex dihydrolipoamide acyltransferase (E2) component
VTPLFIPSLGFSMTEGTILRWHIDDGAPVDAGEPLYDLETDKVENEIESPATGTLRRTGEVGETYTVGTQIGYIE